MAVLDQFNAAMNTGREAPFSDPLKIINDAAARNHVANRFLFGEGNQVMVHGGLGIEDVLFLESQGNFRSYRPNQRQDIRNRQPGVKWRCPFAYYVEEMSWTAQEVESQVDAGLKSGVKIKRLKDLMKLKEMQLFTSVVEGMDKLMFAQPNASLMEIPASRADAEQTYSIPAFINEFANGLYDSTPSGTWTTVQAIDPVAHPNWDNQRTTYTIGSEASDSLGLLAAFDRLTRRLRFNKPGVRSDLFTGREQGDRDATPPQDVFIACSELGYDTYRQATLGAAGVARNFDITGVSRLDPGIARLSFAGAMIEEIEQLNSAALYPGAGTTLATESAATVAGPRFYVIDPEYLQLAFKADRMMKKSEVKEPAEMIDTYYQYVTIWCNLVCTSRRRLGMVYPTAA